MTPKISNKIFGLLLIASISLGVSVFLAAAETESINNEALDRSNSEAAVLSGGENQSQADAALALSAVADSSGLADSESEENSDKSDAGAESDESGDAIAEKAVTEGLEAAGSASVEDSGTEAVGEELGEENFEEADSTADSELASDLQSENSEESITDEIGSNLDDPGPGAETEFAESEAILGETGPDAQAGPADDQKEVPSPASESPEVTDVEIQIHGTSASIAAAEDRYYAQHGKYASLNKIGGFVNMTNYQVNIIDYITPKGGMGYQVEYRDNNNRKIIGYGPEADQRTADWHYSPLTLPN